MKKRLIAIPIIFQLLVTFFAMFFICFLIILWGELTANREIDMRSLGFYAIYSIIYSIPTIIACFILGSPIRSVASINTWWIRNPIISLVGLVTGIVLLFLSLDAHLTQKTIPHFGSMASTKQSPNPWLLLTGWFLTAFFLLHFYPQQLKKLWNQKSGDDDGNY